MDGMKKYEKIIDLPHHVSARHPRMSDADRAAQFAPFAALSGYGASVAEAGRLTEEKIGLGEEEAERLDRRLRLLAERVREHPAVNVRYFRPDSRKEGGAAVCKSGSLKRMDETERLIIFTDGTKICVDDIYEIESEIFGILREE